MTRPALRIWTLAGCLALAACTSAELRNVESVTAAGTTQYRDTVVLVPKDQTATREHLFISGKELETVHVEFTVDKDCGLTAAELTASGIKAFEGQRAAAAAVVAVRQELTKQNIELSENAATAVGQAIRAAMGLPI